jgi:hypothetical protein
MLDPVSLGLTGIGLLGSLFGSESGMTDEQRQTYEMLLKRSKGLDPKLLALMRARLANAVGNEFSGYRSSTASSLRRQNAPIAKQQEIMEKLYSRGAGAKSDALLGVDQLNENIKSGALGQLSGFTSSFPQQSGYGQGFSQLFGAGLQGLLSGNFGNDTAFLGKMDETQRSIQGMKRFQVPMPNYKPTFGPWGR